MAAIEIAQVSTVSSYSLLSHVQLTSAAVLVALPAQIQLTSVSVPIFPRIQIVSVATPATGGNLLVIFGSSGWEPIPGQLVMFDGANWVVA